MQRVAPVLPVVGVADDGDLAGVGGPDGKARTGCPVDDVRMGAHDRVHQTVHPVTHGVPIVVGELMEDGARLRHRLAHGNGAGCRVSEIGAGGDRIHLSESSGVRSMES